MNQSKLAGSAPCFTQIPSPSCQRCTCVRALKSKETQCRLQAQELLRVPAGTCRQNGRCHVGKVFHSVKSVCADWQPYLQRMSNRPSRDCLHTQLNVQASKKLSYNEKRHRKYFLLIVLLRMRVFCCVCGYVRQSCMQCKQHASSFEHCQGSRKKWYR